jgi:hypothetical protein
VIVRQSGNIRVLSHHFLSYVDALGFLRKHFRNVFSKNHTMTTIIDNSVLKPEYKGAVIFRHLASVFLYLGIALTAVLIVEVVQSEITIPNGGGYLAPREPEARAVSEMR